MGGRTPARPRGRARPRPPFRQWADGRVSTGVAAGRCDTRPVLTAGRHCPHLPAALVPQAGLPGGESSAPSASSCCHMSLSGGTAGWPHSRHPLPPPQPSPCRQRRGPGSPARIRFVCRGLCGRSRTFAGHLHGRPGLRFFTNPWSRRRVGRLFYEGPGGTSGRSSPSAAVSPVVGMYAELWRASAPPEASGVALVTPPPGRGGRQCAARCQVCFCSRHPMCSADAFALHSVPCAGSARAGLPPLSTGHMGCTQLCAEGSI